MQYALCPNCSSTLQVSQEQIDAKNGLVRCGNCNEIFDAIKHQFTPPENVRAIEVPQQETFSATDNQTNTQVEEADSTESDSATIETQTVEEPIWEKNTKTAKSNIPFTLLTLLAVIALLYQLVSHYPHHLTQNTTLQPAFERLNQSFGFSIPRYKNTDDIRVLDRQLSKHPTIADTLQLVLIIKNTAPVNQDYPLIHLTLSTAIGQNTAQITFNKDDYLSTTEIYDPFLPFSTKKIAINFTHPKEAVSGFELSFSF